MILDLIGFDLVSVLLFDELMVVVEVMGFVKCVVKFKVNVFFIVDDVYI